MKEDILEQDNPFRPEGELSKEADAIVGAIKEGRGAVTPPPSHSPQAPVVSTAQEAGTKESAVVKVEHGVILTSKTEDVEHVVIQEKESGCCTCTIL